MKLLITTQAVDRADPVLGFFHRWIEEFAKHCEQITVLCLRTGEYDLPPTVRVVMLGKGTFSRAYQLLREAMRLRTDYSAVFVHMNPEYVLVAGVLWRILGKKVVLWYTHKSVTMKLRLATALSQIIFTASKESFRIKSPKVQVMGHGIDTEFFSADPSVERRTHWLSVGRLMPSKRHDLAIRMAAQEHKVLHIVGEGPERGRLEEFAGQVGAKVVFLGPLTQETLRDEYRRAALLVHTSETGSLDKVVLEALACGLPVRTNDLALKHLESVGASYVREHHSLATLIPKLIISLHA